MLAVASMVMAYHRFTRLPSAPFPSPYPPMGRGAGW